MKRIKRIIGKIGFIWQKITRGFSNQDLWNLDQTITDFILPRLKAFKNMTCAHPADLSFDEWMLVLDKMIKSFEISSKIFSSDNLKNQNKEFDEGMKLFIKYYGGLWD